LRADEASQTGDAVGLAVDPGNADHAWAALRNGGTFETDDGGSTWHPIGLEQQPIRWLTLDTGGDAANRSPDTLVLYAGVKDDGIYRRTVRGGQAQSDKGDGWTAASTGLPAKSTILAFLPDPRSPDTLWAGRDGGGIYRSTDGGTSWSNMGMALGDNLAESLAIDYGTPGSVMVGTSTSGVWGLRPASTTRATTALASSSSAANVPGAVDARIEVVWPHNWAPVTEAKQANIGLWLFLPNSLTLPPCAWSPEVRVWQAIDTDPAQPLGLATQRTVDKQPFPYWELNDIDVSLANDPQHKLYFMVEVQGGETATSVWAHGADPRTYFPQQDVPSGLATEDISALDARIQIVWPHDASGNLRPVDEGTYAIVAVELFKHGTRLSVPVGWQPSAITLYGAWNQEVGAPLARTATVQVRQSGAITYPIWEFQNVPVSKAMNPANKLYLWVMVDGAKTYPTVWTHGADARTFFPAKDEPIRGCTP
jgi:hypothetical protein